MTLARASVIDRERCDALLRSPSLGPDLLFFSGGTALRPLCRQLKRYTHNSIHLITPFDSGGSSAEIRQAFNMLAVGDLRNRLLALADESTQDNGALYRLFSYRLPKHHSAEELEREFEALVLGGHALMAALPAAIKETVCATLCYFASIRPKDFKLQGANVGNLLLTGVYLSHGRDIGAALMYFTRLLLVRGIVAPTAEIDAHLAAVLKGGACILGQHLITGKEAPVIGAPVESLFITQTLDSKEPIEIAASPRALELIAGADLICYPYGSFYSSVIANLLPKGVGRAVVAVPCPKLYIPNWGTDPEQMGMTLSGSVERLIAAVRADAPDAAVRSIIRKVLLDSKNLDYTLKLDVERVQALGVEVLDVPFGEQQGGEIDFTPLAETLLSLS